jgi:glycerate-2-kinase
VDAADSRRLVREALAAGSDGVSVRGERIPLSSHARIVVLGAGKAGAGMCAGVEDVLRGSPWFDRLSGWVNVPADCVRPLERIHLHAARPAGINEPTEEGVAGSTRILELASGLSSDDLCLVLLSGGGSALLPAPVPEITLADKQQVTRLLMARAATIDELNCVRRQLSRIKGGGLARAASAARVESLIVSDVVGDPLDVIASGPTVADTTTAVDALRVLRRYGGPGDVPPAVVAYLERRAGEPASPAASSARVRNHVIGNNAVAMEAAARAARAMGFEVRSLGSDNRGVARDVGRELAETCLAERRERRSGARPLCILSGGEPVVHLIPTDRPRKGGRNQELVLAALARLWDENMEGLAILSGGTDGEDGPTDAAGAVADATVLATAKSRGLAPPPFLAINDSYTFFDRVGGLLKTGPTHTNVMDLRVAIVG